MAEPPPPLPRPLAEAAAAAGVVPLRTSSPGECAALARAHGAAILTGAGGGGSGIEITAGAELPQLCFGSRLVAQQLPVEIAIKRNRLGGRLALEGLQGARVDPLTIQALEAGDISMETFTEGDYDGPHLDGPANFGHLRPDFFFLACDRECESGGDSLLLDSHGLLDALAAHEGVDLARALAVTPAQEAAETVPDDELADDGATVIASGVRGPWRNRLVHQLPSGRRMVSPGNGGEVPPEAETARRLMDLWERMVEAAGLGAPRFKLHSGESLLVDNFRLFHGRDAYEDLRRRMFRVWLWTDDCVGVPPELERAYPALAPTGTAAELAPLRPQPASAGGRPRQAALRRLRCLGRALQGRRSPQPARVAASTKDEYVQEFAERGYVVSCHDVAGVWVAFFSRCQR